MDNGAGPQGPGSIGATWEIDTTGWPRARAAPDDVVAGRPGRPDAHATRAGPRPPPTSPTPRARPRQTLPGNGEDGRLEGPAALRLEAGRGGQGPGLHHRRRWRRTSSSPGPSSLDLRLRSSARDTDLQVTLSEVRPDGQETYVQNGWLRASHRHLDARRSTADDPVPDAPAPRRRADAPRAGRARARADLPGRARVPGRVADPGHRPGRRRRPPALGLLDDRPRPDAQHGHAGRRAGLAPRPARARRARRPRAPRCRRATALRGEPSRAYVAASNGG